MISPLYLDFKKRSKIFSIRDNESKDQYKMNLLDKKTIRRLGILFTILFLIISIICIILAAIMYRFVGPDWKPNPWEHLPGLTIASVIVALVLAILGLIVFSKPNIALTIAFAVLLTLSFLFSLAIAIMALVAASHGFINTYFGCNAKFNGVLEMWQGVDAYLQRVDQALCSRDCPCLISNTNAYTANSTVINYYNAWTKTPTFGSVAFQNCSTQVQYNTYTQATLDDGLFDPKKNFDTARFARYMSNVENDFMCTGWCNVTYFDSSLNRDAVMYKYLFSDVNRGPVQTLGCLDRLVNWIPAYLNAWGSLMILLSVLQLAALSLAICQWRARERDHELQVPHHHDDDRKV